VKTPLQAGEFFVISNYPCLNRPLRGEYPTQTQPSGSKNKHKGTYTMHFIKYNTFQRPILTGIVLLLIALGFRLVDIFILRLDERLGEIVLSKALGFA
jgi:hypothetical protein